MIRLLILKINWLYSEPNQIYKAKLTFSSNDQNKIPIIKQLIDFFKTTNSMRFAAKIVKANIGTNGLPEFNETLSFGKKSIKKIAEFQSLNQRLGISDATFISKSQSPFGPSVFYKNQFETNVTNAKLEVINTYTSDLLQLSGVFTGCIRSIIENNTKDKVKVEINDYLKTALGISSLEAMNTNEKFLVY